MHVLYLGLELPLWDHKSSLEGCSVKEWLMRQIISLRIASHMDSNPVRGKLMVPCARNSTLIASYWLVPGMDMRVFL